MFFSTIYIVAIITIVVSVIAGAAIYMIDKNSGEDDRMD
jgi:hypothetical protein